MDYINPRSIKFFKFLSFLMNMKLWLNEILACPEDKHFPLHLYILKWNTDKRKVDFPSILRDYKAGTLSKDIPKGLVQILNEPDLPLRIKDMIAIKPLEPKEYIEILLKSISELEFVFDHSSGALTNATEIIGFIKTTIKKTLEDSLSRFAALAPEELQKFTDELYPTFGLINIVKIIMEVDCGVLFCSQCGRWFPIFDSIPQMLPDKFRVKESDEKFKNEWFKKLPNEIVSKFKLP